MMEFDFKRYHIRSINATNEIERAAINQELKDLYESISEEERVLFNQQLQKFISHQLGRLKSDYESIQGMDNVN